MLPFDVNESRFSETAGPYFADYYHSGTLGWVDSSQIIEIPVNNPENLSCFTYKSDKIPGKSGCSQTNKKQGNQALAFTARMQLLLFSGKLADWSKIKHTGIQ